MERIDARRALELLTDVVDTYGEDTVYEKVTLKFGESAGTLGCVYQDQGRPSCLVGHVLNRAGVPLGRLEELDDRGVSARSLHEHLDQVGFDACRVLSNAQLGQDSGETWGDALRDARKVYELIVEERSV